MVLAIDYDDTYTNFINEFNIVRDMFQKLNHQVVIVTARDEVQESIEMTLELSKFDDIIYTSGKAKAGEIRADIWIDDNPVTLCCDFIQGESAAKPGKALHQGHKGSHILWNWETSKFCSYIKNPFRR